MPCNFVVQKFLSGHARCLPSNPMEEVGQSVFSECLQFGYASYRQGFDNFAVELLLGSAIISRLARALASSAQISLF